MIQRYLTKRNFLSLGSVVLSTFLMAFANNVFMNEAKLLPAGFMGVATLASMVGELFDVNISASLVLLCVNIPIAIFCAKKISKRFVFFSMIQVVLLAVLLRIMPVASLFDQKILNVIFGGCIYGFSTAVALRGGASTGGTDFIALYVSNKTGKEIWMQVFAFNCILLVVFGALFGWDKAGYSIIFQYVSTRMITTFHTRYKRMMMQIFTKQKQVVVDALLEHFPHGVTIIDGTGAYTGQDTCMLLSVTSSYELPDTIELIQKVDPGAIINVTKTDQYYGNFRQPKL